VKKTLPFRLYKWIKQICKILGKKYKKFKYLERFLNDVENSIRLLVHTAEWLSEKKFAFDNIDNINYPTKSTILDLHDFLVHKYEKDKDKIHKGIITDAQLEFTGVKYFMNKHTDPLEDIIIRGAHIFNKFLEEGHPFVDGNKRTGWATLWVFLRANGYLLYLPYYSLQFEHAKRIEQWADGKIESDNITEIVQWIKKYIKK